MSHTGRDLALGLGAFGLGFYMVDRFLGSAWEYQPDYFSGSLWGHKKQIEVDMTKAH